MAGNRSADTVVIDASAEETTASISEVMSQLDGFPVGWAHRDEKGNLVLDASVFEIAATPGEMFGQNIRDFGFDYAVKAAKSEGSHKKHDFGACKLRDRSLRRESDGNWYVDLTVGQGHCRYPKVTTMLVDDSGDPILDKDGEVQVRTAPRKEAWITCQLSALNPQPKHPLSFNYVQRDRETVAHLRMKDRSEAVAAGKDASEKTGRKKGKRARLSADQVAALMEDLD